jgi:hypothetical protein
MPAELAALVWVHGVETIDDELNAVMAQPFVDVGGFVNVARPRLPDAMRRSDRARSAVTRRASVRSKPLISLWLLGVPRRSFHLPSVTPALTPIKLCGANAARSRSNILNELACHSGQNYEHLCD